ncbi:hypothetical protein PM082_011617 [Marasmius tenuissimus]|nr:hypothetical protein PM082_011617 [Marasmius tenuissimus]
MEQRSLRGLIQGPEEQIRQLDEEISRLQAKRQTLKQFVNLHRTLLSPSRRVPADIWRLVFIECLPTDSYGLCAPTTQSAPLLLTTVCRSWREIALSTPNLWNAIHIYLPAASPNITDRDNIIQLLGRKEGLKAWLDRSGSLPITLSLGADPMSRPQGLMQMLQRGAPIASEATRTQRTEFTELLARYAHRWRTVAFSSGIRSLDLTPFEILSMSSLSSMESIYNFGPLFCRSEQPGHINVHHAQLLPFPVAKLLARVTSLRRLELSYSDISASTFSLSIPWYHLTELSLTHPTFSSSLLPAQLMQTLANRCHSLITLSIRFSCSNFDPAAGNDPVQWTSLQKLRMVFLGVFWRSSVTGIAGLAPQATSTLAFLPGVEHIFDSVALPSLEKLSVGFYGRKGDDSFGAHAAKLPFEDLLRRSQCPLTHFELFNPHVLEPERIINVLRQLETLQSLNLGYSRLKESERRDSEYQRSWRPSSRSYRDASLTWRRDWLDRILREFSLPGLDLKSQAINISTLSLCPQLEELNVGGCGLDDKDILVDLATKVQRTKTKIRVDFGWVFRDDVWRIFDMLRIQKQDTQGMRVVRDVGSVGLDLRWDEHWEDLNQVSGTASTDLPNSGDSWWDVSLWR